MASNTSKRAHKRTSGPAQLPDRRIKTEIMLRLTVTLEGEPYERTDAYHALFDGMEPAMLEIASRHIRKERRESASLEIAGDPVVAELSPSSQRPKLTLVTQSAPAGHPMRNKGLVTLS